MVGGEGKKVDFMKGLNYFVEIIILVSLNFTFMVRFGSLLAMLVAGVLIFQSCSRTSKSSCSFIGPDLVFVGFPEDERDTLVIRRYEPNSTFSKPLDTFRVTKVNVLAEIIGKDSLIVKPANYDKLKTELFTSDWEIYLPGTGRTLRISNVKTRFMNESEPSSMCHSFVTSLNFDGVPYFFSTWFDNQYRVFVTR